MCVKVSACEMVSSFGKKKREEFAVIIEQFLEKSNGIHEFKRLLIFGLEKMFGGQWLCYIGDTDCLFTIAYT